jgi:hypothetical protein
VNINPLEVLAVTVNGESEIDSMNTKGDTPDPEPKNASHAAAHTPRRDAPAAAAVAIAS